MNPNPVTKKRLAGEEIVNGRVRGTIKHTIIGQLLAEGIVAPSFEQILGLANQFEPLRAEAVIYRQAARLHVCTGVGRYFRLFLPPASWTFEGYEVEIGDVVVDQLWTDADGRAVIDELKTGKVESAGRDEHARQLVRQLKSAKRELGDRFRAVRVCMFVEPTKSFFAFPDGTREGLRWEWRQQ